MQTGRDDEYLYSQISYTVHVYKVPLKNVEMFSDKKPFVDWCLMIFWISLLSASHKSDA